MTRSEIRLSVIDALRESPIPVRWSSSELDHYIDDGYIDMAERTAAVVATRTIVCPARANFITLPADCLYLIAVKDQATGLPIDPVHWSFLDSFDSNWNRVSATSPSFFAMFGLREIILYPSFEALANLEVILAVCPDGLANDNAEPDLPEEYHYGLVHYAHGRAIVKDAHGDEAGPRLGRARRQFDFYQEAMNGLGRWTHDKHKHIFKATYGEHFRTPELDTYGVQTS